MQDGIAALGADAYPEAIGASGVDPKRHIAPVVGEDFQDAPIDEYPQLELLARCQIEVGGLRRAGQHIRKQGRATGIDDEGVVKGLGSL